MSQVICCVNGEHVLVDRDLLEVREIVTEPDGANYRKIETVWTMNGVEVKRDAHVILLRGMVMAGEQAKLV